MSTASNAALQAACNAIVDLLDGGTGDNATVEIQDSSNNVLATVDLDGTAAFGSATAASPSVATATGLPISFTASGTGTADHYVAKNRSGTEMFRGSVGTSGTEMIIDNTSIVSGQNGTITGFTWTQPNGT